MFSVMFGMYVSCCFVSLVMSVAGATLSTGMICVSFYAPVVHNGNLL